MQIVYNKADFLPSVHSFHLVKIVERFETPREPVLCEDRARGIGRGGGGVSMDGKWLRFCVSCWGTYT